MDTGSGNSTSSLYYLNRTLLRKMAKANFGGCCSKDCESERAMLRRDARSLAQAFKILYDFNVDQMKAVEAMSKLVNGLCVDFGIPKRQACTGVELLQTLSSSLKVAEKYASAALGKVELVCGGETSSQTSSARDAGEMVHLPSLPSQMRSATTQKWQNESSLKCPPLKRPRFSPVQNGHTNGALPRLVSPLHAAKASTSNNTGMANGQLNSFRRDETSAAVGLGFNSKPAEGTPSQLRVDAIAGTSSSSASNFNTIGPRVVTGATSTLVAQRGGESDCNLYRDRTKLYLSVSPIQFDARMHALPLPRLRSNLQLLTPTTPKIHALKTEVVYDNEYCNLQVTVEFDYQPDVGQMIHLAYYLKSGGSSGEDHNKWVHHPPFKCTCRGGDSRMSLTIRFRDPADEFEMIMISVRMNSGHLGTTQFTPPVVVRLGRLLAGRSTCPSVINADIDFFLHHLPSVAYSATEGTGGRSANNFSTLEEMLYPPAIFDGEEEAKEKSHRLSSDNGESLVRCQLTTTNGAKSRKRKAKSTNSDCSNPSRPPKSQLSSGAESFGEMNLCRPLLRAVSESGFMKPTPIQSATIPPAMAGRDICACSATGTGKTAAFMLPILERLFYKPLEDKTAVRVLILEPTRELASQVLEVGQKLASRCGVGMCLCTGGVDAKVQEGTLRSGVDVIVATPGRLIDLVTNSKTTSKTLLKTVEVLVLDEADRMLDEAFEDQIRMLIRLCPNRRQTMLFSATMTDEIKQLAGLALEDPVQIFVNEANKLGDRLVQEFIRIRKGREEDREAIVAALVKKTFSDRTLVFVKTKLDCDRIHALLEGLGVTTAKLHGDIAQHYRTAALERFREGEIRVLCCTDVAARGLDIVGVKTVINMHVPTEFKNYIHRVGRTARAGAAGRSISLIGENERSFFRRIAKLDSKHRLVQRKIPIDVLIKYKQRIDALKPKPEEGNDDVQIYDELTSRPPVEKRKQKAVMKKLRKQKEKISS